ncbi:cytochrome c3 family protein [Pendulispora rubella]|uniref:Cytochrome c3 family protein n=1 Tax=Pendulispora rubella TaxID=2741070 RepID=A0ABZ2KRK0_9BACT
MGSALTGACVSGDGDDVAASPQEADGAPVTVETIHTQQPTTRQTPIGLALDVDNAKGTAIKVRSGQTFFLNQIDLRAWFDTGVDEDIDGLRRRGDFADLSWRGLELADESALDTPDAVSGLYTNRRFFRNARWMNERSFLILEQLDGRGRPTSAPLIYDAGIDRDRRDTDDFFVRRTRGIQWTFDCKTRTDCTGAKKFREEALVELRNAMHPDRTFYISAATTQFRLTWSLHPGKRYTIPVTQDPSPAFDYGFNIDVKALTAPREDGTYPPGGKIKYQISLLDGAGHRLHPEGSLPTYNDVRFKRDDTGISYYQAFFDATTTYYRRKHRERMLMSTLEGPAQDIQPSRTIAPGSIFFDRTLDVQPTALPERDGFSAQFRTFPTSHDLFGGEPYWDNPVPDTWEYTVPANAKPGTYYITTKGRRVYRGEDIPASHTVKIQVGSPEPTTTPLGTGPCNTCHSGNSSLGVLLHANNDRATCTGCHVPLEFELEGNIYARTHFIHSRSNRIDARVDQCEKCHITAESIQRTSKSACLSCHKSYPEWHVRDFGPIDNMYVGATSQRSFDQCTSACHVTHPGSKLGH